MLRSTDKIQILALYFIHHSVHFLKGHNACNNIRPNHKRRHNISKASVNHKVTGIGNNSGMKPCNIAHKIVETVARNSAGSLHINAVESLHNIGVIRNLKIGNERFAESLNLNIFAVVLADGNRLVDDIRYHHHALCNLCTEFCFTLCKFVKFLSLSGNLLFNFFRLVSFALCHQSTDLLRNLVSVCSEFVRSCNNSSAFLVKFDYLVNERKFFILKFFLDVFLYDFRIFSYKFNV